MTVSDEDLVKGCLRKSKTSEAMLYNKFAPRMYGICLRYAGNEMEANDILQNAFFRVFKNIDRYRFEGSLEGWIRRITINAAITFNRQMLKYHQEVELKDHTEDATISEDILSILSTKDLLEIIRHLPPGHRTVFNLYVIEGYDHKEIANLLGISEGTSKSQLHRAKQAIRRRLDDRGMPH